MNKSKLLLVLPFVLGSVLLIAFHFTLPAAAASGAIDVNTTADESGTGAACSLREAIQSANTNSDFGGCTRNGTAPYTINLPGNTYTLSGAGDENFNATGDLGIADDIGDDVRHHDHPGRHYDRQRRGPGHQHHRKRD
jgi:CSLREA domain-containing protein